MTEMIKIKAMSKRNGLTVTLASVCVLALTITLSGMSVLHKIPTYFLVVLCLAGLLVGAIKMLEPEFSLIVDKQGITYYHVRGKWHLDWADIQRIDIPTIDAGLDKKQLPYVAFRLKSQETLLKTISPRLASHLVTEQREIVIAALQQDFSNWQCADGSCPSEILYKFEDYKTPTRVYKGLIAMFGHRIELLRDKLGYDLYLPASAIDRDPDEFVRLLRRLQATVV